MKKNKKTKVSKYITVVLCLIAALIIAYVIIYLCFKGNGILTAGINLEKHDWLSFLGTYLSFAGRRTVKVRYHHKCHYLTFRLVTVVNLLCQFVQRGGEDINPFVLPFLPSGDTYEQRVLRNGTV